MARGLCRFTQKPTWPATRQRHRHHVAAAGLAGRQPARRADVAKRCWARCRRARPASASAAPSGRCSQRSSWRSSRWVPVHVAADIGCHAFATFEPFSSGHSILGYGMSLASRAGVSPMMQRRSMAVMGDGGFWHNGLLTGVQARCSTATTRCC
jgi:indolepyruvate ferredoxin oxidoreductase alpha subunit